MQSLKDLIRKIRLYGIALSINYAWTDLKRIFIYRILFNSYSQEHEDIFVDKFLNHKKIGFYVDIGANDPAKANNTKMFYDRGWSGINIEPDEHNSKKFTHARTRDINLNVGISESEGKMIFYKFFPDTLSTFSGKEAEKYQKSGYTLVSKIETPLVRLDTVLKKYALNKKIDFISIDTEGFDVEVLKSNDWNLYRPYLILIECVTHEMLVSDRESVSATDKFLTEHQYKKVWNNGTNGIYIDTIVEK